MAGNGERSFQPKKGVNIPEVPEQGDAGRESREVVVVEVERGEMRQLP